MLGKTLLATATFALWLGSAAARADHDRELAYVVGGPLLGATLVELAHERHYHRVSHGGWHWHGHGQRKYKHRLRAHGGHVHFLPRHVVARRHPFRDRHVHVHYVHY